MTKEQVLSDIQSLIQDIDKCSVDYFKLLLSKEFDMVRLGDVVTEMYRIMVESSKEFTFLYDYIKGLWKNAQDDELPEIDREVIVLIQDFPQYPNSFKVGFGHRPDPKGWDAKSIITEKTEHYVPQCYDKGGWNQPNVKYWLDLSLPIKKGGKDE